MIGERYYIKSETHFYYNEFMYHLFLRRAIHIKHGKIDNFYDEYFDPSVFGGISAPPPSKKETVDYMEMAQQRRGVEETPTCEAARQRELDSLSRTITDPFLRQVLSEKRASHQLTDIICTIQENQNNIIRLPISKNLIVQGCAGSGKTMILVHRLSYLKFNNPNLVPDYIKIITPNNLFNMHIDNLSKELELDKIQRLTMEDYYRQLLGNYDKQWDTLVKGNVEPESSIDQNFINYIYSLDFASSMKVQFELWVKTLPGTYQELLPICQKYEIGISWGDSLSTKECAYSILKSISETRNKIKKSLKEAKKYGYY